MIEVIRDVASLRNLQGHWRHAGQSVGLVPTMGALHAGHMALVKAAREQNHRVLVTIFVNPTQFGPDEDLESYPDTFAEDIDLLTGAKVDAVFVPSVDHIYPDGFATTVKVSGLTDVLCGAKRPGHFDGVTQVVTKLFNLGQAERAYFGQKDWQQLAVVRRLARDLNFATEVIGVPTVRDENGLALSSRNSNMTEKQREIAPHLHRSIRNAAARIAAGHGASGSCYAAEQDLLLRGFRSIDYLECRDGDSLEAVEKPSKGGARVFAAAYLGDTRLIDNVSID